MRSLLALLLLLAAATGAKADTCQSAPTRDCVLEMAFEVAADETSSDGAFFVQDLLDIARIVESSGTIPMEDFAPIFFDRLQARVPSGSTQLSLLSGRACGLIYGPGPVMSARLIDHLSSLEATVTDEDRRFDDRLDASGAIARCLGARGDMAGLETHLADHPDRVFSAATALALAGHLDEARSLTSLMPEFPEKHQVEWFGFRHVLATGEIDALIATISALPKAQMRYHWLGYATERAATPAQKDRLKAYANELAAEVDGPLPRRLFGILVKDAAKDGDWEGTLDLVARVAPDPLNADYVQEAFAILAGVTGDYDMLSGVIGTADLEDIRTKHKTAAIAAAAARAAHGAGRTDLDDLLDHLDFDLRMPTLAAWATAQFDAGDIAGGTATYRQFRALGPLPRETFRQFRDLSRALAKAGHTSDAIHIATAYRDAPLLAEIAVTLDCPSAALSAQARVTLNRAPLRRAARACAGGCTRVCTAGVRGVYLG